MSSKKEKALNNCLHHKYKKVKLKSSYTVYKCQAPGCTHFITPELLEGRIAKCYNGCEEPFLITKAKAKLARPHCDKCTRTTNLSNQSKVKDLKKLESLLDDLGI